MNKDRNIALDVIRFTALLLVVLLHSAGLFYVDPSGGIIDAPQTRAIVSVATIGRAGVPLFVMISGYLLLPMRMTCRQFYSRRFTRVLLPFIFWSVIYAIFESGLLSGGSVTQCLKLVFHIPVNFVTSHLWYVYMLIGLYLLVPVISPWIKQVGKREFSFFLILWLVCSLIPYVHLRFHNILGEATWNHFSSFYYFQGFIGYFIWGAYLKKYGLISLKSSLSLFVIGYTSTIVPLLLGLHYSVNYLVTNTIWDYCSLNLALMSIGLFGIVYHFFNIKQLQGSTFLVDFSKRSYAIYLAHVLLLRITSKYILHYIDSAYVAIPIIMIVVLLTTYLLCRLMSKLPYADKWLG